MAAWGAIATLCLVAIGGAGHVLLSAGSPSGAPIPAITIAELPPSAPAPQPTGTVPPAEPTRPSPGPSSTLPPGGASTGPSSPGSTSPTAEPPGPTSHGSATHDGQSGGGGASLGTRVPVPEPSRAP